MFLWFYSFWGLLLESLKFMPFAKFGEISAIISFSASLSSGTLMIQILDVLL